MINRINIYEKDYTGIIRNQDTFNTVLIPGFADGSRAGGSDPKDIADFEKCPVGIPVVCENLTQFRNIFGSRPAIFYDDQAYPKVEAINTSTQALSSTATDNHINNSVSGQFTYKDRAFDGYLYDTFDPETNVYYFNDSGAYETGGVDLTLIFQERDSTVSTYADTNVEFLNAVAYSGDDATEEDLTFEVVDDKIKLYLNGSELSENTNFTIYYRVYVYIENKDSGNSIYLAMYGQHYEAPYTPNSATEADMILFATSVVSNAGFDDASIPADENMFNAGDPDPSYIYATELLSRGMTVAYIRLNENRQYNSGVHNVLDDVTVTNFYDKLLTCLSIDENAPYGNEIIDTNGYPSLKYITSGGYPVLGWSNDSSSGETRNGSTVANAMLAIAAKRGDCIALIDHTNNKNRALYGNTSVFGCLVGDESGSLSNYVLNNTAYGSIYTPWAKYTLNETYYLENGNQVQSPYLLPASFDYLCCIAEEISRGELWAAVAGVNRGINNNLITLNTSKPLTSAIADYYQAPYNDAKNQVSINAITNINPYGLAIWGNRTLFRSTKKSLMASSFMNIRSTICDIKKYLTRYAKECMFEQNTDILFGKFSSKVASILDDMQTSSVLAGYTMVRNKDADPTKVSCTLTVYPTYAIESFDIYINISDQEVIVD